MRNPVKTALEVLGFKTSVIAGRIGISGDTLKSYRTGRRTPPLKVIKALRVVIQEQTNLALQGLDEAIREQE